MFKENTVFILGAGASYEAGFPLGSSLATTLAKDLNIYLEGGRLAKGDQLVYSEMVKLSREGQFNINQLIQAGRMIADGVEDAESIDNYVNLHADNVAVQAVAKLGIVVAIARAEKQSRLFNYNQRRGRWEVRDSAVANQIHPRQTWYQKFFEIAKDGVRALDIEQLFNEVRVICFNYDRSLELFLLVKIMSLYAVDMATAARAVQNLKVIRPYGGLGALPQLSQANNLEFGELEHYRDYWRIGQNIRTYSELPGSETTHAISSTMSWAKHIVFLGFGFHQQNMSLLVRHGSPVFAYGTTYGLSDQNTEAIRQRVHRSFNDNFHLHVPHKQGTGTPTLMNQTCCEMMSDFKEVFRD